MSRTRAHGFFFNLNKTFDNASLDLLFRILERHCVREFPKSLFANYLVDRVQLVKLGYFTLKFRNIKHSHGSVLGPLLSLFTEMIFTNLEIMLLSDDKAEIV